MARGKASSNCSDDVMVSSIGAVCGQCLSTSAFQASSPRACHCACSAGFRLQKNEASSLSSSGRRPIGSTPTITLAR